MAGPEKDFRFAEKDGVMEFASTSYRAERGSILHAGIYNYDLSAIITGGVLAAVLFITSFKWGVTIAALAGAGAFAAGFILSRALLFKRRELVFHMDREAGTGFVKIPFKGKKSFLLRGAKLGLAETTLTARNPEGIKLVEKIALHHYTVLPDFEKPLTFITVELETEDGEKTALYAAQDKEMAEAVYERLNAFIRREDI